MLSGKRCISFEIVVQCLELGEGNASDAMVEIVVFPNKRVQLIVYPTYSQFVCQIYGFAYCS